MPFLPSPPKPVYTFTSLAYWEDKRKRWEVSFAIANPRECMDFNHLVGQLVRIDGDLYRIVSVDLPIHQAPYRKDERISVGANREHP